MNEPTPATSSTDADRQTDRVRAEIAREQLHVDRCYEELERAREVAEAGVRRAMRMPVSTPQSQFEREAELHRSQKRLGVIATSERQLVFGRLDMEDVPGPVYVGRVGLSDSSRNRILVDWRAPVGSTYYRATAANPRGVIRRRTLVTRGQEVVELNDDLLIPEKAREFEVVVGEGALLRSLERERGPYMQDILATIQGEQDEIIRADPKANVVLTGGPGTGKSVVALHRTAYLMFERAEELERRGVLFVGPTARFSRYISRVLPSLGETAVQIRSVFNLTDPVEAASREPIAVARLKGRIEMAAVVRSVLVATYPRPSEPFRLRTGRWTLDLSPREIVRMRDEALRGGSDGMNRARARMLRSLARRLLDFEPRSREERKILAGVAEELTEESAVDGLLESVLPIRHARNAFADVRRHTREIERAAARSFSAAEARALAEDLAEPAMRVGDLPLYDEVRALLGDPPEERSEADEDAELYGGLSSYQDRLDRGRQQQHASAKESGFGHIVVDEAQDLTPMQWRTVGRLGRYATWNIVGDPNQATLATPQQMQASIDEVAATGRRLAFQLGINYRTPVEIVRYAARLSGLDLSGLRSIRESGREPAVFPVGDDAGAALREALGSVSGLAGSVCVIAMDAGDAAEAREAAGDVDVLEAIDAKGLEWDNVVLYRPERLLPVSSPSDASLLLIAATRATRSLTVVTAG